MPLAILRSGGVLARGPACRYDSCVSTMWALKHRDNYRGELKVPQRDAPSADRGPVIGRRWDRNVVASWWGAGVRFSNYVVEVQSGEIYVRPADGAVVSAMYDPLNEGGLASEFFGLGREKDDPDRLLMFVRRWGLLGFPTHWDRETRWVLGKRIRPLGDPVEWAFAHARGGWLVLQIIDALRRPRGMRSARKVIKEAGEAFADDIGPWVQYGSGVHVATSRWSEHSMPPPSQVTGILDQVLNENLADAVVDTAVFGNAGVRLERRAVTNLGAAYWRIAQAIEGPYDENVGRCAAEDCGRIFVREDGRQRYCPPAQQLQEKESSCAMRERQRRHRSKRGRRVRR